MAAYYTYLISSLPVLSFGQKPPFSKEELLRICRGVIPDAEVEIMGSILRGDKEVTQQSPFLKEWFRFDVSLRNELVRARAFRKKIEPHRYLRGEYDPDAHIAGIATAAVRNPSIIEGERMLDTARWQAAEEFVRGHYFDAEVLFVYALKLSILLRWEMISAADKIAVLEEATKVS